MLIVSAVSTANVEVLRLCDQSVDAVNRLGGVLRLLRLLGRSVRFVA